MAEEIEKKFCYSVKPLYIAYNKSVQEEAVRKFGNLATARTAHGIAYRFFNADIWKRIKAKLFPHDVGALLESKGERNISEIDIALSLKIISNFCNTVSQKIEDQHFPKIISPCANSSLALKYAEILWGMMGDINNLYTPLTHDYYLKMWQLDPRATINEPWVMFDEAQDANPVIWDVINRSKSRKVIVGDPWQSVYGFRGAFNAIDNYDAPVSYLTQSFRFGVKLADIANAWLSKMPHDKPKKKLIGCHNIDTMISNKLDLYVPTCILCRTKATLFYMAEKLIGEQLYVIGGFSEIKVLLTSMYGLLSKKRELIKHSILIGFKTWSQFVDMVDLMDDRELLSLICIVKIYKDNLINILSKIDNSIVSQEKAIYFLSTGHKAKGLEWAQVYICDDFSKSDQLLDEYKLRGWSLELREEFHLGYVAQTRAIYKLVGRLI